VAAITASCPNYHHVMGKNYNYVWVATATSLRCKMAADYTKMALAIIAVDRKHLD